MIKCTFDNDRDTIYNCKYKIEDNRIKVTIEKGIFADEERILGKLNLLKNESKDYIPKIINIFNLEENEYFKLYNCNIISYKEMLDVLSLETMSYVSDYYIKCSRAEELYELDENSKVSSIRIFHPTIKYIYQRSSVEIKKDNLQNQILLKKHVSDEKNIDDIIIEIQENNIDKILIKDSWDYYHSFKEDSIKINLWSYAQIDLIETINLDDVIEYIKEFQIYMELLMQNNNTILKLQVEINNKLYNFFTDKYYKEFKEQHKMMSVETDIKSYLIKCYKVIPIRHGDILNRSLYYFLFHTIRNIEDSYLIFYRFVECYYKTRYMETNFIVVALNKFQNTYNKFFHETNVIEIATEIDCLRNHYVHNGYHIIGEKLFVSNKNNKKTLKELKVKKNVIVDFEWILKRTQLLYDIVLDVIYHEILGFKIYKYKKKF